MVGDISTFKNTQLKGDERKTAVEFVQIIMQMVEVAFNIAAKNNVIRISLANEIGGNRELVTLRRK